MLSGAILERTGTDKERKGTGINVTRPPLGVNTKTIEIPIPVQPWPTLPATLPMSNETWDKMLEMLENVKPALVEDEPARDENGGE